MPTEGLPQVLVAGARLYFEYLHRQNAAAEVSNFGKTAGAKLNLHTARSATKTF